jgi:hypothetical protein
VIDKLDPRDGLPSGDDFVSIGLGGAKCRVIDNLREAGAVGRSGRPTCLYQGRIVSATCRRDDRATALAQRGEKLIHDECTT